MFTAPEWMSRGTSCPMLMWDGSPISRQTVPGEVFSLLLPTHSMLASLLPACEAPRNGQDEGPHCALWDSEVWGPSTMQLPPDLHFETATGSNHTEMRLCRVAASWGRWWAPDTLPVVSNVEATVSLWRVELLFTLHTSGLSADVMFSTP